MLIEKKFLKPIIKVLTFELNFVSESNGFNSKSRKVSLNGNVYNVSVDYTSIDKYDIF